MEKLTRFEKTRIISARALQLSLGAPTLVKGTKGLPPEEVAKKEIDKKALPLLVIREYPDGKIERISAF